MQNLGSLGFFGWLLRRMRRSCATRSLLSRAQRRFKQLQSLGKDVIYTNVLEDLRRRDRRDMDREIAPLVCAEGAVNIDTTDMAPGEVLKQVLETIK